MIVIHKKEERGKTKRNGNMWEREIAEERERRKVVKEKDREIYYSEEGKKMKGWRKCLSYEERGGER